MTLTNEELIVRRRRFTVDEYHRMVDAGVLHERDRVELLDGEVVTMSPIGSPHAACVARLTELLVLRLAPHVTIFPQSPLSLDPYSEPEPDLTVARRKADFYASGHPEPGDALLVIEVGDTAVRFDRRVKAPLYARAGVTELWLVDLNAGEVQECRKPTAKGYTETVVRTRGERLAVEALPALSLTVDEVLGPPTP